MMTTFVLMFTFFGFGIYNLLETKTQLEKEYKSVSQELKALKEENESLSAKIDYFKNPENVKKELKSQFYYRETDEKLIVVIPSSSATSASSSSR